jgi:hypothetical protein
MKMSLKNAAYLMHEKDIGKIVKHKHLSESCGIIIDVEFSRYNTYTLTKRPELRIIYIVYWINKIDTISNRFYSEMLIFI